MSQVFSSWYFSWTSGDPHRSGFKLHTAVLSVLCVMFQVQLSFFFIIIIIIIIIINCNWVITRWQWLFYMYTNTKKK